MPVASYGREEIRELLAADLPSGPVTKTDAMLWDSLSWRLLATSGEQQLISNWAAGAARLPNKLLTL